MTSLLLGLAAALAGCLCFYFASEHQRWLAAPWPKAPARAVAVLLLVLAWVALAQGQQRLTASFTLATAVMLALALLPYLGALRALRRARRVAA